MEQIFIFSCIAGVLAIIYGFVTAKQVLSMSAGTKKMREISNAIQIGASAYLKRQYFTIALVGIIIFIIIAFSLNISVALGFLVGAILSGMAGFIGMHISVRANVRTTEAAKKSLNDGLGVAFKSGAVTGMLVAGLALLSIAVYYYVLLKFKCFLSCNSQVQIFQNNPLCQLSQSLSDIDYMHGLHGHRTDGLFLEYLRSPLHEKGTYFLNCSLLED